LVYTCENCENSYSENLPDGYCTISFVTNNDLVCNDLLLPVGYTPNLPYLEKDGYNFLGWYLDEKLTNRYASEPINENLTLYANWKSVSEAITILGT
jgi:uncharacterized repeat protein (TIGR02543 family)